MPKDEVLTESEDDIDVVEIDAPAGEEAKAAEEAAAAAAAKKKEEVVEVETDQDDDDDDSDHEDARLAEKDESPEEEEKRKKRLGQRQRQKANRYRERQELEQLRREVAELKSGYTEIRNTNLSVSENMVASKLEEVRRDIATAESLLADAVKNQDGDTFAAAIRLRDEAKVQEADLIVAQKGFVEAKKPPAADGEVARLSGEWKRANGSWYGTNVAATNAANAIDAALYAEMGDRANTREYYQELSRRVTAHFNAQEGGERRERQEPTTDTRKKGPAIGDRGGNGNGAPGGRKVFLSKDRVDAIKAAGDWDDPTERAKAIKAYEAYDREQSANR